MKIAVHIAACFSAIPIMVQEKSSLLAYLQILAKATVAKNVGHTEYINGRLTGIHLLIQLFLM